MELEIDDPATPQIPDYTASQNFFESDDWGNGFELGGLFDIQPGHLVTVSDRTTIRQHTVTHLAVTNIDVDADTVSGTGYPGAMIHVGTVCDNTGCASRNINVDENGIWIADFSVPVIGHGDAGMVFDLRPGMGSGAYEFDDDEDATNVSWQILNPFFSVHQDEDWLEGYDWPTGVTVNISIDDPSTPQNPDKTGSAVVGDSNWNPSENYFSFDLSNTYDIQAGFQVVVSGGGVTKAHAVTNLVITNVNAADDTVSGTSDPNAHLRVDVHNTDGVQMEIDSDSNGDWLADFTGQFDLKPGDSGRVQEYDIDWDSTGDDWRIPNPSIGVRANNDQVEGWEWPLGATIVVTVDDPSTAVLPDITRSAVVYEASWNPGEYRFDLNLYGQMDIQPGFVVTATLDDITKTLIVTPLAFTDIDVDLDLVTGIAAADSRVDVWSCGNNYCVNRHVTASNSGVWSADFAHPGLENDEQDTIDIVLGTWIDSSQREEDGDQTMFGQNVPNPYIEASSNNNWVRAREWPRGTLITMTISGSSETYTATMAQASWNPNDPNDIVADFDLQGYDIQAGDVITASADGITKELMVSQLEATEFDIVADTVSGIATPGVQLQVCANIENRCITRWVTADPSGVWTANYHDPGTGNDDLDTFDVQAGSNGWAAEYETDSDRTWYDWQVPNPNFAVHPDENVIEGNEWPLDSIVTIKIGDPIQPDYTTTITLNPPDQDHNLPWFNLDLSSVYDLLPGELITVSDTVTTKQVVAASRSITLIDPLTDIITGVSDPGVVYVVLWACDENGCVARRKDVNSDGSWSVNFAVPGELNWESLLMDIQPATNGGVYQSDVDGDGTVYQWILNQPPQADLGPDLVTDEGSTLMLDASASSDPESDLMTYAWDLDNDGEYDDAVGVTTSKSFPDNGTYTVGLKVTDQYGESDTDTAQINVVNVTPLADIQESLANNTGVLSGNGAFTDPGADIWTATVNYGDGTGIQSLAFNPDKTFLLNHTYIANGNYTVEVCVSDDDSASNCDQSQVTVTLNLPPIAEAGGPYVGYEGTSIPLNASRSTDPDNTIVLYEWDFDNDGLFDDATGARPKFAAIDNGIFSVRVRVIDAGGLSSEDSSTVTVKNVPPVITSLTFNSSVRVGVKLNTYATFKDVGINDTFTATWKWGDGTISAGAISGKTVNGSHIYAKPGIYLITITVKDKDGGVGQAYKLILVLPKR
ncbi:MAG: PKD domain-containing protein [Anaerolineales bacterium]|nr:PKD domain-containing protein [Anaerolineales bacterium]